MAEKRLRQDLTKIFRDPPPGVSASPVDGNLFEWNAIIFGPEGTPFEGGSFRLRMKFEPSYPNAPPKVFFYSRMFHPNVYPNGRICLDILEEPDKWKPEIDASSVLFGIQAMLGDPNPDSPANGEANKLYMENPKEYERRAREVSISSSDHLELEDIENENACDFEKAQEIESMLNQMVIDRILESDQTESE